MIRVQSNAPLVARRLGDMADNIVKRATVFALNDTAADILESNRDAMRSRFDRPTRFTQNAFIVWRANVKDAEPFAEVRERPSVGSRHYLKVQERGGKRPLTGMDRAISAALPQASPVGVIPTRFAKTDKSGNWSRAERRKSLAAVKQPGSIKALFVASEQTGARGLPEGIYKRLQRGKGIRKIAHFEGADISYKPLLGFFEGGEQVWRRELDGHFDRIFTRLSNRQR
ncbi:MULTISPECIES: hypothetical protein [unclassified Yoonia]|uniref:hypothetical protein n=1 Tax=unclassified Yoonia TaxID=2629118 RepID=UPI002AFF3021|nr:MULTISPECIES: hypothetical protein [unclassified Yoonia]